MNQSVAKYQVAYKNGRWPKKCKKIEVDLCVERRTPLPQIKNKIKKFLGLKRVNRFEFLKR